MKHAKIYQKDEVGRNQYKGEAILLNCMDSQENKGFWEYKLLENMSTTHCAWIENSNIFEG